MRNKKAVPLVTVIALATGIFLLVSGSPIAFAGGKKDESHNSFNLGRDNGYDYGYKQGERDRNAGARYNFNTADYKRGDLGYDRSLNYRLYKTAFRKGYKTGYNEAYYAKDTGMYSGRKKHRNMDTGTYPDRKKKKDTGTY